VALRHSYVERIGRETGETLARYLSEHLKDRVKPSQRLDLMLLALGQKPGALLIGVEASTVPILENFCRNLGFYSAVNQGQDRSLIDRLLRRDTRLLKECFFAARHGHRLELLDPDGDFCGTTDRATGKFLGYPEQAVDRYADGGIAPAEEVLNRAGEMVETGAIERADLRCTKTVSYIPCPERGPILDCVEDAKKRVQAIEAFDERFDTEIGERLLESVKPMLAPEP